ncbi:LTA synthase family protein [Pseudoflavonifractor sp. 524-17]|uniref:LTA synthase family protein n=1 Tax=Pseudoflavonifractor sp. 524-17 TaxID=2304577 RepID=UPI00137B2DDE|nr:LTA synthase family protein [Pseudoflavonifractor sp. 524-17]NCE64178.1 LTA synthase family protein [Pseudoflavonifractor sp. 524-17]
MAVFFCAAPLLVTYLCQLITLQDAQEALDWLDRHTQAVFFTYGALFFLQAVLTALTRRVFWGTLAITLPCILFSVANHLKETVNGTPILASDLTMTGQAGQIAAFLRPGMELGRATWQGLTGAALLLIAALFLSRRPLPQPPGRRLAAAGLSLSLLGNLLFFPGAAALLAGPENESQGGRNQRLGLLAGIYSALCSSAMEKPDTYSRNNMERILRQLQALQTAPEEQTPPHIVLVVSESFFDITRLPNLQFYTDPIPNYHALLEESAGGRFLSAAYAGGTGNVEMELFTGIPSAFPGLSESLTTLSDETAYHRVPSLVKALAGQGYQTVMVHSYNDSLYNRSGNMPAIGFDTTVYDQDFTVERRYAGGYLSDDTLADQLIAQFEARGDGPLFLYGLSMENHQPYFNGKYDTPSRVDYACPTLTGDALGALDALVHGLHDADAALGRLVDYFSQCDEPVLLLFLGDHLPGLYLEEDSTLYTALGVTPSPNTEDWDAAQLKEMHLTDYVVWNNYGAALEAPEELSVTQTGAWLLDWAGLWKPLWFIWVQQTGQDMRLYRDRLFVDGQGNAWDAPTDASSETVSLYRALVYDILYGEHYISQALTEYDPQAAPDRAAADHTAD